MQAVAAVVVFFWCATQLVAGEDIIIGGELGWSTGVNYPEIHVQPGDKLVFTWNLGFHDLWRIAGPRDCSMESATRLADTADTPYSMLVNMTDIGQDLHFGCMVGDGGHCIAGQHVTVKVVETRPEVQVLGSPLDATSGSKGIPPSVCSEIVEDPLGFFTRSCLSAPVTMIPGGMANTRRMMKNPYPLDRRVVAIDTDADVVKQLVDGSLVPAPLSEVYVHHFLSNIVPGEGAEFRRKQPAYKRVPEASEYGDFAGLEVRKVVDGALLNEQAAFHFIDIRGVQDYLPCVECRCRDKVTGTYLDYGMAGEGGGISCCANCTSTFDATDVMDYFLQYNVTWTELNRDVMNVQDLTFDAARAIGKRIEYQVKPHTSGRHVITWKGALEGGLSILGGIQGSNQEVPEDVLLIMCGGHMHIGGLSMMLTRTDTNQTICSLNAIYGKELGEPGNELGFLVGIEYQQFEKPMRMSKSTPVELVATYNATELHTGVMSLFSVQYLDRKYALEDAKTSGKQKRISAEHIFDDVCDSTVCDLEAIGLSSMQSLRRSFIKLQRQIQGICADVNPSKECRNWQSNFVACAKETDRHMMRLMLALVAHPSISIKQIQSLDRHKLAAAQRAIPPCGSANASSSDNETSNVVDSDTSQAKALLKVSVVASVFCTLAFAY